jgi:hypothetical protein
MALLCHYSVSLVPHHLSSLMLVVVIWEALRLTRQYMVRIQEIRLNFIGLLPISHVFREVFLESVSKLSVVFQIVKMTGIV